MEQREQIMQEIRAYATAAQSLEENRKDLAERIMDVVKSDIIPQLTPSLPDKYSISPTRSKVVHDNMRETVPINFIVVLRLEYDGQRIKPDTMAYENIRSIRHNLKSTLEELASRYGLASIRLMGEPVITG